MKDKTDAFLDAMIRDRELRGIQAYVQRGRVFETMGIDELNRRWLDAFEQAFVLENWSRAEEANDLEAEIRLRGTVPPDLPERVRALVQSKIENATSEDWEANLQAVRRFRESLDKPKNS